MGDTALHAAAWKGHRDAVSLLLDSNIDASKVNNDKKTAQELARDPAVVDLISKHVCDESDEDANGYFGGEEEEDDEEGEDQYD